MSIKLLKLITFGKKKIRINKLSRKVKNLLTGVYIDNSKMNDFKGNNNVKIKYSFNLCFISRKF